VGEGAELRVAATRKILAFFVCGLVLAGCEKLPSYRYKLTIIVDTAQGPRLGASVREVRARKVPRFLPDAGGTSTTVVGEAVAVDLPQGKTLYALLDGDAASSRADQVALFLFFKKFPQGFYPKAARRLAGAAYRGELPRSAYPAFVTFENQADPRSVRLVDPDQLAATLGAGTKIRAIELATTKGPVTWSLASRLPWLASIGPTLAGSGRPGDGIAAKLKRYDFIRN
jgi:hypothetical protein